MVVCFFQNLISGGELSHLRRGKDLVYLDEGMVCRETENYLMRAKRILIYINMSFIWSFKNIELKKKEGNSMINFSILARMKKIIILKFISYSET